jgi:hypothetical protein
MMQKKFDKLITVNNLSKPSRSFNITLNEVDRFDKLKNYLKGLAGFTYAVAGEETAPSTGHKHIHIFIQYEAPKRLCISKLEGAHIEKCFSSPQQNYRYVTKGGKIIWEEGKMRKRGFPSIADVKEMTEAAREKLPVSLFHIVKKINSEEATSITTAEISKHVKVYYISGRSGIGKTRFAYYLIGKEKFDSVKYENGFWIGVTDRVRICLYDDFRDSHMTPSEFIHFIDYNQHYFNIKGGCCRNKYTIIIITSIQPLSSLYGDASEEDRAQWERRIHEIKLSTVYNDERAKLIRYFNSFVYKSLKKIIYSKLIKFYHIKVK